jgi:hypothetical protein
VAISMNEEVSEQMLWLRAAGAGALVLLSCLFWLQQFTNCLGVGLLVAMRPPDRSLWRRAAYMSTYAATGLLFSLLILVSGFRYTGVVHAPVDIHGWTASTSTAPAKFEASGVMKAAYSQAAGIVKIESLSYRINGLLIYDPRLLKLGSFPWQFSKFIVAWILLAPLYLYPLVAFPRATPERKTVLASFFLPLAVNMAFAVAWLGSVLRAGPSGSLWRSSTPRRTTPRMDAVKGAVLDSLVPAPGPAAESAQRVRPGDQNYPGESDSATELDGARGRNSGAAGVELRATTC